MNKRTLVIAVECFIDLGVTIAYAAFVGLLIVAIVASDDWLTSIWRTLAYASLLPTAAAALVGAEALVRIIERKHDERRAHGRSNLMRL